MRKRERKVEGGSGRGGKGKDDVFIEGKNNRC